MVTVDEIIKRYLKKNSFDGLFCEGCACSIDEKPMCNYFGFDCMPGYEHKNKETCPPYCKNNCFGRGDIDGSMYCAYPVYKAEVQQ